VYFPSEFSVRTSHVKAHVNQNFRKDAHLSNSAVSMFPVSLADLMLIVKRALKKWSIQYLILTLKIW